jgi:hypothetical protein
MDLRTQLSGSRHRLHGDQLPHSGELLTGPVNDPMGEEVYQCRQ